jgi:dedicator of cytokinesis protein 3
MCVLKATSRYVVSSARRPAVNWPSHADPSSSAVGRDQRPSEDVQQVTLGIFPASHIFERDRVPDAEQRLAAIASRHSRSTNGSANGGANGGANGSIILDDLPPWAQSSPREEDADADSATRKSARLPPPGLAPGPEQATSSRTALTVKTPSIRSRSSSPSPTESGGAKPAPPRPTLKSGDDTAAGAAQPLVDEIAAALREWHALLYTYLARREYRTFGVVRAHIEALHLARRQLLAQTFSAEETTRLRRECVLRLASGNIAQGLHVVVRHPTWGALATVNVDGERDARSWMSAVRMYALQVALAYLDAGADALGGPAQTSADTFSIGPAPTPSISSFPAPPMPKGSLLSGPGDSGPHARLSSGAPRAAPAKFFHVFLEVRAFVASLCAPGERAELFFSLYNRAESQFFTEDFCAVLTHNGVLARDPAARIRALFVDLAQSDAQDPIFLVVRIVRAGALKIGTSMSTGLPEAPGSGRRGSEIDDARATQSASNISLNGGGRVVGDTSHLVRRPFGWAVLELSQLRDLAAERGDMSSTKEFSMPIFVPTHEEVFSMLHQDIIANNIKEFEKSPRLAHNMCMERAPLNRRSQSGPRRGDNQGLPRRRQDDRPRELVASARRDAHATPRLSGCRLPGRRAERGVRQALVGRLFVHQHRQLAPERDGHHARERRPYVEQHRGHRRAPRARRARG